MALSRNEADTAHRSLADHGHSTTANHIVTRAGTPDEREAHLEDQEARTRGRDTVEGNFYIHGPGHTSTLTHHGNEWLATAHLHDAHGEELGTHSDKIRVSGQEQLGTKFSQFLAMAHTSPNGGRDLGPVGKE